MSSEPGWAYPPGSPEAFLHQGGQQPGQARAPSAGIGASGGVALAVILLGVALSLAGHFRAWGSPAAVVSSWHSAARAGDLERLRSEQRLGAREWANGLVQRLGERDYARVIEIYTRAERAGGAEYDRLANAVRENGDAAWNEQPIAERYRIGSASHRAWVSAEGAQRVPDAAGSPPETWTTSPPPVAVVERLGTARLTADEQQLINNRPATDPAVSGDAMLARIATKRQREGERIFNAVARRVAQEGERAFRRLDRYTRNSVDGRSRAEWQREQGLARLSETDRQLLGDPAALDDGSLAAALRYRLGLRALTAAERREVEGKTRAAFEGERGAYVERVGSRMARAELVTAFGASHYTVHWTRVVGLGPRDLVQRGSARVELRWTSGGSADASTPRAFTLGWEHAEWEWRVRRIDFNAPGGGGDTLDAVRDALEGQGVGP